MSPIETSVQDVMQVCRNGHIITDRLHSCPERARTHCDRCGAVTLERCPTCGHDLPGAFVVPGLHPLGVGPPPRYCATCGVAFSWTKQTQPPKREAVRVLEDLLRRLPLAIRQLRVRHTDRPPFRVEDERDLEDLLRAILPLRFDDVRPESRTPRYADLTRTDFLLASEGVALTVKCVQPSLGEQLREDAAYHRREGKVRVLVAYVHDPQATLREPPLWRPPGEDDDELEVRCVLGTG